MKGIYSKYEYLKLQKSQKNQSIVGLLEMRFPSTAAGRVFQCMPVYTSVYQQAQLLTLRGFANAKTLAFANEIAFANSPTPTQL